MQGGWRPVAIKQYSDATPVRAPTNHNANLSGEARAANGAKLTHLDSGADWNSVVVIQ